MKTISRAMLMLLTMLAAVQTARAQGVSVTVTPINQAGLDVFFLRDFDITRPSSGPPIFTVNITNTTATDKSGLVLELVLVSARNGRLAEGRTRQFSLLAGTTVQLTNNQLFTNTGRFAFDDFSYEQDLVDDLIRDILATGKLPTDVYTFQINIIEGLNVDSTDDIEFRVTNPRKLDLIYPGAPVSARKDDCPVIFTGLPQFRWESDLRLFRVIIAEARDNEDPESSLNQEPRFVGNFFVRDNRTSAQIVPRFDGFDGRVELLPGTTFQYPSSGEILQFKPGQVYYWRVIGFIQSSSGPIPLPGEIYCFRMADFSNLGGRRQQVEVLLRNLMGDDFDKLFGEGGEFAGYDPQRMTFEDKEVTMAELLSRLPVLRRNYQGYRVE